MGDSNTFALDTTDSNTSSETNQTPQFQTDGKLKYTGERDFCLLKFNATDANGDTLSFIHLENSKDSQFFQINTITGY